jgi:hypothetical protein
MVRRKPWNLSGSLAIVFNPPAWCGAARTLCVGDVETPLPWWKLLSGGGIKVTKGAWKVILLCECFNNVDLGWLSAYRYHKINCVSRVCFLSSLFTFFHLLFCNLCLPLLSLSSILLGLAIGCKPCFGMGVSDYNKLSCTSR